MSGHPSSLDSLAHLPQPSSLTAENAGGNDSNLSTHGNNPHYWYSISDGHRLVLDIRGRLLSRSYLEADEGAGVVVTTGEEYASTRENNSGIFLADPYYYSIGSSTFSDYLNSDIDKIIKQGAYAGIKARAWARLPEKIIIPILSGAHWRVVCAEIDYGELNDVATVLASTTDYSNSSSGVASASEVDTQVPVWATNPTVTVTINDPYGMPNVSVTIKDEIKTSLLQAVNKMLRAKYARDPVEITQDNIQIEVRVKEFDQQGRGSNGWDCGAITFKNVEDYLGQAITGNSLSEFVDFTISSVGTATHDEQVVEVRQEHREEYARVSGIPINEARNQEIARFVKISAEEKLSQYRSDTSDAIYRTISNLPPEQITQLFTILENKRLFEASDSTERYTKSEFQYAVDVLLSSPKFKTAFTGSVASTAMPVKAVDGACAGGRLALGNLPTSTGVSEAHRIWEMKEVALSTQSVTNLERQYYLDLADYDKAIEINPDDATAYYNKAGVLQALGRNEEALACYDEAIKLKPDLAIAYSDKGNALFGLGRNEEAFACFEEAIRLKSDFAIAYSDKGNALFGLKRNEEALASYDEAIRLNPDLAEAYSNKGNALFDLKRNEEALACYNEAIRLEPDYADAYNNKGVALSALGQSEEAIACFDEAIRLKPYLVQAYYNKGVVLRALRQSEEAIACFDEAIRLKPDYADAYYNKGGVLRLLCQNEEAIVCYDEVIRLEPNNAGAFYTKGIALFDLKRNEEALACYDEAIRLKPDYADAYYNKGGVLRLLCKNEEAIVCYDEVIRLEPNDADAFYSKGIALFGLGRNEEAIACYDETIRLKPDYADAYINKSNALRDLVRNEEAIACCDEAIQIEPKDARIYNNKGLALVALGRNEEAIACYDEAIKININYILSYLNKGILLRKLDCEQEALECINQAYLVSQRIDLGSLKLSEEIKGYIKKDFEYREELLRKYAELSEQVASAKAAGVEVDEASLQVIETGVTSFVKESEEGLESLSAQGEHASHQSLRRKSIEEVSENSAFVKAMMEKFLVRLTLLEEENKKLKGIVEAQEALLQEHDKRLDEVEEKTKTLQRQVISNANLSEGQISELNAEILSLNEVIGSLSHGASNRDPIIGRIMTSLGELELSNELSIGQFASVRRQITDLKKRIVEFKGEEVVGHSGAAAASHISEVGAAATSISSLLESSGHDNALLLGAASAEDSSAAVT